ncbi:hypothetical protein [Vulgatibacter sp.]|uniref:hypothetical protein n=1 Tax=Vulgatibacter sp. TaxID=1971226 RepID=UPI0035654411
MKRIPFAALACALLLGLALPAAAQTAPANAPAAAAVETAPAVPSAAAAVEAAPAPAPVRKVVRPNGPVRRPPPAPSIFDLNEKEQDFVRIAAALAVIGLLLWSWQLEEKGQGKKFRVPRRAAIAFLGLLGVFGWFNYGKFHSGTFVHVWEHYHYYIGAKYFPELRYARLYECSAIAETEMGRTAQVRARMIRDLADTNLIGPTTDVLANPERCKQHFTAARWEEFKTDIRFFVNRLGGRWAESQKDHGYNGTPWWNISGQLLANAVGPASERSMFLLALLDPLFICVAFGFIWWAFGLEIFAVAATFFAVNFPSRYYWNGGAFLRYDYLAYAIIGICLLKKRKSALGGGFLAATAALRLFPLFFAVGPAVQGIWHLVKKKAMPTEHKRILVGALVASALLVPTSLVVANGGTELFSEFKHNTQKHSDTPLTNHMGLRTFVSWRPWDNAKSLKNPRLDDPFQTWKEERLANFDQLKLLFLALNLAFLWAVWRASRDEPAWFAAALSGTVLITTAAELTCYYYAFLIPGAFLMEKRKEIGLWLIVLGIGTHAITRLGIWDDDKYVWMSVASVAWCVSTLYVLLSPEAKTEASARATVAVAGK